MSYSDKQMQTAQKALQVAIATRHPDPHRYVAAAVFEVDEHMVKPEQRDFAKRINYLYLYDNQPRQDEDGPYVHNNSGRPYTLMMTGRDVKTLRPTAVYTDAKGMCWLRPLDEFKEKFTRLADADVADLEKKV